MPPTAEDVRRVLHLISSRDELEYFYDHLDSPDWIPALREAGLFENPPEPVEEGDGVWFPGWGVSRYLVRMAPRAPELVVEALEIVSRAINPRVRMDLADALLALPAGYAPRFVPAMARWIHDPYRLGLDRDVARLIERLVENEIQEPAVALLRSFAALVPPDDHASPVWFPVDNYEYGEYLPRLAAKGGAAFGRDVVTALAEELSRGLEAEYGPLDPNARRQDLSFIWRPAIEDHSQNQDFDSKAKLVVALRDAVVAAVESDKLSLESAVEELRGRDWPLFWRLALHGLERFGDRSPELVKAALTDEELFRDTDVHHEFYRLAARRFGDMPTESKDRYLELVERVPVEVTADDEPEVADRRRLWWRWNRLGAVAEALPDPWRERYASLVGELGQEKHPDFLTYHSSWTGPNSPLSADDVVKLGADALIGYLAEWRPDGDEMRPSPEGLARTITEAVKSDPAAYASSAPRYLALEPAYARGLLFGFREALRAGSTFDWAPVLELSAAIARQPIGGDEAAIDRGRDPGWAWARTEIAHLIEAGLDPGPGEIPVQERERVWAIIQTLAEDADPTPETEARFGSPNMDPMTHSINTTRGVALHAAIGFGWWLRRGAGEPVGWRLSDSAPEVTELLDRHLDLDHDPSVSVRSVYGWWLPWIIAMDEPWAIERLDRLLGDLSTPHELAAWEAYVIHGQGDNTSYGVLASYYLLYADLLAGLDDEPSRRISGVLPVERYVDHLVRLRERLPADEASPLLRLLTYGRAWLVSAVVENAGRILHGASELEQGVSDSFYRLWKLIRTAVEQRGDPAVTVAVASFGWWFASPLPAEWTLPELIWTLDQAGTSDPGFLVLERLADVAQSDPGLAVDALQRIVASSEHGWELRAQEAKLRTILSVGLAADDEMLKARTEALTNRLGRLGLHGLRTLLA